MTAPIKFNLKTEILPLALIIVSLGLAFYAYPQMPARVISHWNFQGQPDGYMDRFWGAFMGPVILAGMYLLFIFIPYLDPRRDRYQSFEKIYHIFRNVLMLAMFSIFILATLYNLGQNISIGKTVPIIIGCLFIILGNYMGKIKSNWFMGVRNPWTLSSEDVWNKTHRISGWLFGLFGLFMMLMPFLPQTIAWAMFIIGIILLVFGTNVYSYLLYRKEQNK